MKMHVATRTRIPVDMTLDFDPTGTTIELKIDDTWHPCTWQGTPTKAGAQWKQTALTNVYFAGPEYDNPPAGTVVLSREPYRHLAQTRVTNATGEITWRTDVVDVIS